MSIRLTCLECSTLELVADVRSRANCRRCGGTMSANDVPPERDPAFRQPRYVVPRQRLKFFGPNEVQDRDGRPILFLDRPRHFRPDGGQREYEIWTRENPMFV